MNPSDEEKPNPYQPSSVPSEQRTLTLANVGAFLAIAGVWLGLGLGAFLVSAIATSHIILRMNIFADRFLWSCLIGSVAAVATLAIGAWKSIPLFRTK